MSNKDIKFAERTKPSPGDTEPKIICEGQQEAKPAPKQVQIQLRPFKDGVVLRHSTNPRNPATQVLHDSTGTPLGVVLYPEIAEMICQAVTFLFHERERVRQEQLKNLDAMSGEVAPVVGEADGGPPFVPVASPELKVVAEPDNNGTDTSTP